MHFYFTQLVLVFIDNSCFEVMFTFILYLQVLRHRSTIWSHNWSQSFVFCELWASKYVVLNTGMVVGISACIVCVWQCVFLVYCFAPVSSNGSLTLYNKVIRPFILKHQKKIDETLGKAAGAAQTALNEGCFFQFSVIVFFHVDTCLVVSEMFSSKQIVAVRMYVLVYLSLSISQ